VERRFFFLVMGLFFFVVFRWHQIGLAPDAALYAGLSYKVLESGSFWRLGASPGLFPNFFEHPPYVFGWGALVLKVLGVSDGAARAIGGLPSLLAFLSLIFWSLRRLGFLQAALTALMLLTFGHYTKYAMSSYLEGALSLGVLWALLGAYEYCFMEHSPRRRYAFLFLSLLGCAIATSSKGVAGFGVWGTLFVFRWIYPGKISWRFLALSLFACLLPMGLWAWQSYEASEIWHFAEYWKKQVFRSFTSNRGDATHSEGGSRWTYVGVILKYGWPWWWTVPVGLYWWRKKASRFALVRENLGPWALLALINFGLFFLVFSLSRFQLPHYLHPTYLPLAPIGAYFLAELLPTTAHKYFESIPLRWTLLSLGILAASLTAPRISKSPNRGQEFYAVQQEIAGINKNCLISVSPQEVDPYRMESFALWYFRARPWEYDSTSEQRILWSPVRKILDPSRCSR
jgi:4-amino-4-deoxy-L-arabinose transferase-like glycosyltransferase